MSSFRRPSSPPLPPRPGVPPRPSSIGETQDKGRLTEPPPPGPFVEALGPPSVRVGPPPVREMALTIPQITEQVELARLVVHVERDGGGGPAATITYDGDDCRIGSHPSNDVVLQDRTVSRFHCHILRDGAVWRIIDSSSRNGTKLDGVRVRDAELGASGVIQIGGSSLRLTSAETGPSVELPVAPCFGQLGGSSLAMRKLFALLERVATSDINVLVTGESGTGKELVATELVRQGNRAEKPFVIVDCGSISPQLIESELFGHARGAFTGADRDRVGAFEAADTGTVFLDEIGELPLELQPKLLRALEAREVRRVGETRVRKIDVRVISATNRELDREVNKGRFREDLYFRLAVIIVRVPALRERLEDLLTLIRVFLNSLGMPEEEGLFSPEVLAELGRHDWPGNVRELRNYVERTVVLRNALHEIREVTSSPVSTSSGSTPAKGRLPFRIAKEASIETFERQYLSELLEEAAGNLSKASRLAAMDRMYLHKLVQKYGLRGGSNFPPPQ